MFLTIYSHKYNIKYNCLEIGLQLGRNEFHIERTMFVEHAFYSHISLHFSFLTFLCFYFLYLYPSGRQMRDYEGVF